MQQHRKLFVHKISQTWIEITTSSALFLPSADITCLHQVKCSQGWKALTYLLKAVLLVADFAPTSAGFFDGPHQAMKKPHYNNLHWIKHVYVFETRTTQKIVNVQNFPKMVGVMSSSAVSSICWWWLEKPICIKWLMLITRMDSSNLFLDIMFCLCLRLKLLHHLQVSLMGQPPRLHHHCQSLQWEPASSLQTHYQTFSSAGVRCLLCQAANLLSFCTRTSVVGCWVLLLTSSPLPSQSSTWQEGSWLHVNFFPHYTMMLSADRTSRNHHFFMFFHSPYPLLHEELQASLISLALPRAPCIAWWISYSKRVLT